MTVLLVFALVCSGFVVGFACGLTERAPLRCKLAGHRLYQGVPENKPEGFSAWLYGLRCGHTVMVVNRGVRG